MPRESGLVVGQQSATLPGGFAAKKRGTLGLAPAEGFSFQGFLRGYLANSNGPAWGPPSKSNPGSKNEKYYQRGAVPEDVRAPSPRAMKSSGFHNHYQYFEHVSAQQNLSGKEDKRNQCQAAQAKNRRQRVLFAPFENRKASPSPGERDPRLEEDVFTDSLGFSTSLSAQLQSGSSQQQQRGSMGLARFKCLVGKEQELLQRSSVIPEEEVHLAEQTRGQQQQEKGKGKIEEKGKGGFMSVLKALSNQQQQKKEACDSIRFLVFGCLGNESMRPTEKQNLYKQRRGTKEEVFKLYQVWSAMDEDGSGDVEFQEFLNFFSKNKSDRLLGMRCVKYLVGQGEGDGCTIEDMMKLIWLETKQEDIDVMLRWFREAAFDQERIPTPPLLSRKKKRQLMENFTWIDRHNAGTITYMDLVDSGLVDAEMAVDLMEKYDADGSGDLDCDEFLELMCPHGYRAHVNVREAVDKSGRQLTFVANPYFSGWTVKGAFENLQNKLLDEEEHAASFALQQQAKDLQANVS